VRLENTFDKSALKSVGGVDISFPKGNKVDACVGLTTLSFPDLKVVFEAYKMIKLTTPYIPGLLDFREVPWYIQLIEEVKVKYSQYLPQVILVDGNGILHPRGLGTACHLGVKTGIPCLGVAKKLLYVDGATMEQIDKSFSKNRGKGQLVVDIVGETRGIIGKY